jgi:hypothetical protein
MISSYVVALITTSCEMWSRYTTTSVSRPGARADDTVEGRLLSSLKVATQVVRLRGALGRRSLALGRLPLPRAGAPVTGRLATVGADIKFGCLRMHDPSAECIEWGVSVWRWVCLSRCVR